MSHAPLVSVVMPVYNHERYVVEAIGSVFAQSWRPIELIVIDDGSTDASVARITEFLAANPAPEGVSVVVSSRANQGAHATINEGLRAATGTYLAILNSDDAYLPERLTRCVTAAQEHRARMVFTYVDPIDDDGQPLPRDHRWRSWYADVMMEELDIAPSVSALLLRYNIGVSTGNFVFHRSVLDDVGYFEDFRYAHDIDYLLRLSLLEEPVILREKLYRYRVHTSNTITESTERVTEEYAEIVRRYLARTLDGQVVNPFAPSLENWAYSFAAAQWPDHLARAVDRLLAVPVQTAANAPSRSEAPSLSVTPAQAPLGGQHVTLVSHELSHTGAPVLLRDVAASLHRRGVSTNVISLGPGPLAKEFEAMGCPVAQEGRLARILTRMSNYLNRISREPRMPALVGKGLRALAWPAGVAGHRLRIRAYLRTVKGALLINSFACWPLALALLKRWRGPAYWYIHETYEPGLVMRSESMNQRLRGLADRGAITFLFGSEATRAVWAAAGYDGAVRYWSGLPALLADAPTRPEKATPRRVVLSVQSSSTRKGTRALIEAFALGLRNGWIPKDVELRIIGCHPPSRNALSRDLLCRISQPDLRGTVSLVANLAPAALEDHYRQAEVYVQSSIMECLPLALLTAMAHGLPIVSTDADGCREAILDGKTGRLVPQRQIEIMARAIGDLLADPEHARTLGTAAKARFTQCFALEATAPVLLETLLGKDKAPHGGALKESPQHSAAA